MTEDSSFGNPVSGAPKDKSDNNIMNATMMESILKSINQSIAVERSEFMIQQRQKEAELKEENNKLQKRMNEAILQQQQQQQHDNNANNEESNRSLKSIKLQQTQLKSDNSYANPKKFKPDGIAHDQLPNFDNNIFYIDSDRPQNQYNSNNSQCQNYKNYDNVQPPFLTNGQFPHIM